MNKSRGPRATIATLALLLAACGADELPAAEEQLPAADGTEIDPETLVDEVTEPTSREPLGPAPGPPPSTPDGRIDYTVNKHDPRTPESAVCFALYELTIPPIVAVIAEDPNADDYAKVSADAGNVEAAMSRALAAMEPFGFETRDDELGVFARWLTERLEAMRNDATGRDTMTRDEVNALYVKQFPVDEENPGTPPWCD